MRTDPQLASPAARALARPPPPNTWRAPLPAGAIRLRRPASRDGLMAIFNPDPTDSRATAKEQSWLARPLAAPTDAVDGHRVARNTLHPDVWVQLGEQNLDYINQSLGTVLGFVISGRASLKNEAELIRRRGGTVIHISGPTHREPTHQRGQYSGLPGRSDPA